MVLEVLVLLLLSLLDWLIIVAVSSTVLVIQEIRKLFTKKFTIINYMKGYKGDIEKDTLANTNFRKVLYTSKHSQLVLMSLKPGEEIGNEVHSLDQFIRIEQGQAKVILQNGETEYNLQDDWAVIIPAGTYHNVINTGKSELKLYTLYSPPEHQKDTVQSTKEDEKEEHFDGKTSEND